MNLSQSDRKLFYIDDHAVLFGMIAKSCFEILGDAGLETCRQGVATMARERGQRSAIRCLANGDDLTIQNYFCYAELYNREGWNKTEIVSYTPVYRTNTTHCAWFDTWDKYGLDKYAPVYCNVIDRNIVHGFNPQLRLEMDKVLASGDSCCGFKWVDCCFNDKVEYEAIIKKREQLLPHITKDFLYQSGHLLATLRRTINLEYGIIVGNTVIDSALSNYAKAFSAAKAECIFFEANANNFLSPS